MALSFGADGREVLSCDATLLSDSATRCCRDAGLVRVEDGRLLQEEYVFGRQYHGGGRRREGDKGGPHQVESSREPGACALGGTSGGDAGDWHRRRGDGEEEASRFSLSALAGRGSLWRPKTPKEVFQGLNEHSIFDSPLQEAISVLGDLSRTLDDDDRRLDALKHVITLLHEPELNAMRDVAGVAETETVKDDAVLQEWLGTRTSSCRLSAMGSAKRFGRLLRRNRRQFHYGGGRWCSAPAPAARGPRGATGGSCRVDQAGAAYKRRNDCGCDARARYRPMGLPRV